ncbi:molybdopterin-dependent oxidoreductase [uncultured Desulfuromusa sp.]|uniref:molybdopterin-containing oxidoreductase family protein n=1 Tax=uncultured Desulfuromusa sp. TaxID=219183 RepID=UPI002AA7D73A|nr:molybdopterin-dependent oxidoreductase [uncultured Desulfuromusa sp.]
MKHRTTKTNCRLCSYLCGLEAQIVDEQVVSLKPDPSRYPYDSGIVKGCARFHSNLEFLNHPERINYPLKRAGKRGENRWQRISWDQALDEIGSELLRLREDFGAETLSTSIGGPHTTFWPLHRFMNLFGSPNNVGIGQICWNPSIWVNSLTFGWPLENEIDPETTECVILWGVNPAESDNSLFWRQVLAYNRTGKPLVVIDPRKTRTARLTKHWLAPIPGTDAAFALGMLHVIIDEKLYPQQFVESWCHGFEQLKQQVADYTPEHVAQITGLTEKQIIETAKLYARANSASIFHGRGIDQIGANSVQVHRGIACLKGLTGNIDHPGASHLSGMPEYVPEIDLERSDFLPPKQRNKQLGREKLKLQTFDGYKRLTRYTMQHNKQLPVRYLTSAQPNLVWRAMLESQPYPIRAMVVSGSNPLICQADSQLIGKALKSLDLLVALELFPNSVTALADYVLPMAGSLERPVLQTNAGVANIAYGGPEAIKPLHERRCDYDFWRELGLRCNQQEHWPWKDFTASLDDILAPLNLTWEAFCETGLYAPPPKYHKYESYQKNGQPGFATPSGKIELYSELLDQIGSSPLPVHQTQPGPSTEFPLLLITGGRKQPHWASSFRWLETLKKPGTVPQAEVSQATAEALGLDEGQQVIVQTPHGKTTFTLSIATMKDDVVSVDYGWWFPEQPLSEPELGWAFEANANNLTTASFETSDPILGQWIYNRIPCSIYPAIQEQHTVTETNHHKQVPA